MPQLVKIFNLSFETNMIDSKSAVFCGLDIYRLLYRILLNIT